MDKYGYWPGKHETQNRYCRLICFGSTYVQFVTIRSKNDVK